MEESIDVFLSYAHKDKALLERLLEQLVLLKRQKIIGIWHDREISAGRDWQLAITLHLNTAHLILLLISPAFMASEYCYSQEMARALARHDAGEARVIPIILRPVIWQDAPFGKLQALPYGGKPVTTWQGRDAAFLAIAQGIRTSVQELRARKVEEVPIGTTNTNLDTLSNCLSALTTRQLYSLFRFLTVRQGIDVSCDKRTLLQEIRNVIKDDIRVVNKIRRFAEELELANVLDCLSDNY